MSTIRIPSYFVLPDAADLDAITADEMRAGFHLTPSLAAITAPAEWIGSMRPKGTYYAEIICSWPTVDQAPPLPDELERVPRNLFITAMQSEWIGRCGHKVGEVVWRGSDWEVYQRHRAGQRERIAAGSVRAELSPMFATLGVATVAQGRRRLRLVGSSASPERFELSCAEKHVSPGFPEMWRQTVAELSARVGEGTPVVTVG